MQAHPGLSRRHFLASLLAASVAPQFVPARVLGGETAPSRTIRLGHIGTGGQGSGLLGNFLGVGAARRFNAVRWAVARTMVNAWLLTIPVTAALGYVAARLVLVLN